MLEEKKQSIALFLLLLITFFSSISTIETTNSIINVDKSHISFNTPISFTADESIIIENDDDMISMGFPGSGTLADPYLIQNLEIRTSSFVNPAIKIMNTNLHFKIQNCILETNCIGIHLINVSDGTATIKNNQIINCDFYGIAVYNTNSIIITDNYVNESSNDGIHLEKSNSSYIGHNTCEDIYWEGIDITYVGGNTTVEFNTCRNNREGILALYCDEYIIRNNTFYNNMYNAIYLWNSAKSTIYGNNCSFNDYGVRSENANKSFITYNHLVQNDYGIILDSQAYNNTIHHNYFVNSSIAHARDDGTSNIWYDMTINEGNWWEGWTGGVVNIIGSAGSIDPYPLGTPLIWEFPVYFNISFIVLSTSILALIINKRRKS